MSIVSPREIRGNRGDIASRYGILCTLLLDGQRVAAVFAARPEHVPEALRSVTLPYGPLYNLWPRLKGVRALRRASTVIWTGGLDLQDDSSLLKLVHVWLVFASYRALGLKVLLALQGAGPLTTASGRWLARRVLVLAQLVVTRDSGSYGLLSRLMPTARLWLAADGIFLPGFPVRGEDVSLPQVLEAMCRTARRPLIGLNLRLWFHFASSIIPYQFRRDAYRQRSEAQMRRLVAALVEIVIGLRHDCDARIILISMYEPGTDPWEDDAPWLQQIKAHFPDDPEIVVMKEDLPISELCGLFGRLDLMIGTRLHATLIALRVGVPAIHLAYTLKGPDIYRDLGLADWVIDLATVMRSPQRVREQAVRILADPHRFARVHAAVDPVVAANREMLLKAVRAMESD